MATDLGQTSPLELYLAYEYLPVEQHTAILNSIANLYGELVPSQSDLYSLLSILTDRQQVWQRGKYGLPLCIESAETGQSVTFKFGPKGSRLPSARFEAGALELVLPRWTAAACVTGVILTGGNWAVNQWLDTELKRAQIDGTNIENNLKVANIEKTRAETSKLLEEVSRLRNSKPGDREFQNRAQIELHIHAFQAQILSPNIKKAEVNGVDVRGEGEGPGPSTLRGRYGF